MTRNPANPAVPAEPAIALADFLQTSFAAQRSGHQRARRAAETRAARSTGGH
jgi:hypothetical protein